jgi:hypothetical protein
MLNSEVEEYGRVMQAPGSDLLRTIRVKRVAEQAVDALDEVATKTIHSISWEDPEAAAPKPPSAPAAAAAAAAAPATGRITLAQACSRLGMEWYVICFASASSTTMQAMLNLLQQVDSSLSSGEIVSKSGCRVRKMPDVARWVLKVMADLRVPTGSAFAHLSLTAQQVGEQAAARTAAMAASCSQCIAYAA